MTRLRGARVPWRRAAALIATAVACAVLVVCSALPASAHARLVSTDPADGAVLAQAPDTVSFAFNEPVNLVPGGVRVFDARGERVEADAAPRDATLTVDLPATLEGTYVVSWRVVSTDGHPVAGALTFSVGAPSSSVASSAAPSPSGAEVPAGVSRSLAVAQGLSYIGLFLTAGLAFFAVVLLPGASALGRIRRRLARLTGLSAALAAVAVVATVPLTAGYQQGLDLGETFSPQAWSMPGPLDVAALVAVALGLLLIASHLPAQAPSPRARAYVLTGVALLVVSPAFAGHPRAFSPGWLLMTTDVLHVLAGSIWLGGLVGIAVTLLSRDGRGPDGVRALARFSTTAASILTALLASGALLSWRIVGSWHDLTTTTYGALLLAKLVVVLVVVLIAVWNRVVLVPRARGRASSRGRHPALGLGRTASLEAAGLVAVLVVTGFLSHQQPRSTAAATARPGPATQSAPLGDLHVEVVLEPALTGSNTLRIRIEDASGEPVESTRPPVVSLRSQGLDLGAVQLTGDRPGSYGATAVLPTAGTWRVQVSLRQSRFENPVATVRVPVSSAD